MNIDNIKTSTIFTVDDNPENLKVLDQYLSELGHDVVPLRSGAELLNLVQKRVPDLILLDIMMPGGMNGYETCRRLKTSNHTRDIPVIFMSALTDTYDKVKGFNVGAVDYITKPIETEELLSRIQTHLSINHLQKELQSMNVLLEEKVSLRTKELKKSNLQLKREITEHKQTGVALKERATRLELLAKVGQKTIGILSLSGLLNQTVRMITTTFNFYNAVIFLVEGDYLVLRATTLEVEKKFIGKAKLKIGLEGISGWVAQHGKPLLVPDVSKDKRYFKEHSNIGTKSEIAVPIKVKEKIIGVMDVLSTEVGKFKEIDVFTLQTISDQLAIAIENARLYEQARAEIAERKKINEELIIARDKAQESDRIKSSFLATVSHELRTPLNAIIGFSDLMNEHMEIDEIMEFRKYILNSGKHLLILLEDIFQISLIASNELAIKKSKYPVNKLMRGIDQIIEKEILVKLNKKIEVSKLFANEFKDYQIITDKTRFNQIFQILISNALKFTEEGSIEYGCEFSDPKHFLFYVKDTGIGIPKDKQDAIFHSFRQVEETDTRQYGGLGIGLSIARNLVEAFDGEIWVESEEGKGSIFYFTLPCEELKTQEGSQEKCKEEPEEPTDRKLTILIAEDEIYNFEYLSELLKRMGVIPIWAKNGKEAVEIITSRKDIDLILMDIRMPVMDGIVASSLIRKTNPDIPIIAQTAYTMPKDIDKVMDAGINSYISKPINGNKLKQLISEYLRKV